MRSLPTAAYPPQTIHLKPSTAALNSGVASPPSSGRSPAPRPRKIRSSSSLLISPSPIPDAVPQSASHNTRQLIDDPSHVTHHPIPIPPDHSLLSAPPPNLTPVTTSTILGPSRSQQITQLLES
ncbi:hypothetical protein JAAARDRAFT_33281, partial [Jaapia argillacea MUCL 33604]